MKRVLLASASALAIVTGSAFAADVIPEPVPAPTWTGLHVGVGGGAGYNFYDGDSEASLFADPSDDGVFTEIISNSINGDDLGAWYGFGTVEIGFDYQFEDSPFVIGILANYDFNGSNDAEASSDTSIIPDVPFVSISNSLEAELDDAWFLGGRLGFAFHEDTLIYALGGYTWVDGKVKAEHVASTGLGGGASIAFDVDEEDSVDGWTIGAGIEHMLTENLSLKVEYRHDFLDELDFTEVTALDDDGDPFVLQEGSVDFSRDTVRAVLSWRFNPFGM